MEKRPHYLRLTLQVIIAGVANAFILSYGFNSNDDSDTMFYLVWFGAIVASLFVIYFWVSDKERIIAMLMSVAIAILLFVVYYYQFPSPEFSGILFAAGCGFGMVTIGGLVNGLQRTFFGSNEEKKTTDKAPNPPEPTVKNGDQGLPQAAVQAANPSAAYCTQCGHALTPQNNFCPECGYRTKSALTNSPNKDN